MAKMVKAALLGLGTVGSGVYKLIQEQQEEMANKAGAPIEIEAVLVHDIHKKREGIDPALLTDRWEDIINNEEIEIVIEVMGGIEPGEDDDPGSLEFRQKCSDCQQRPGGGVWRRTLGCGRQ